MSGPSDAVSTIPEPLETDDDDVSWALQTAAVQWKRGAYEDAIAWLRRGADSAVDSGLWERASQLNVIATQLEKGLQPQSFRPGESSVPAPPESLRFSSPSSSMPAVPPSMRPGSPSSSMPVAPPSFPATGYSSPASPPSTPATAHSKWPTGFPPSAVPSSGAPRAYAPPPPLPGAVKAIKPPPIPPIPPRPKPIHVRAPRMTAPEIQLGAVEELDMSEAELVEFGEEEVTYRGQVPPGAIPAEALEAAPPSAPDSSASLPSYDLDEDPMDGTTALPAQTPYPVPPQPEYAYESQAPEAAAVDSLPAFPLEDSIPAAARTSVPPVQQSRRSPLPQISLRSSPLPPAVASSKPPAPERLSRPASGRQLPQPASVRPRTAPPPSFRAPASERVPASVKPATSLPAVSFSDFAPRAASSQAPAIDVEESASLYPPVVSMDDLDAASAEYDDDEVATSVPPPISERHDDTTEISKVPISMLDASPEPMSMPPPSSFGAPMSMPPPSAPPSFGAPMSMPPPSAPPSFGAPVSERPRTSERAPKPSVSPSQPPQHIDRETPIPSSIPASQPISLRGIALSSVRGLCDLPEESQRMLRQRARIERMGTGEDLSFFSIVLVLEGWVKLMPAIADVTCATAAAGEVVFTQGSLEDGVALRVVAGQNGTTLATWDRETFDEITKSCPWVADELRLIADSFQALAGTSLGMLGERLDDALREVVTSRCQVLTLLPAEILVHKGKPVPGMHIVGAGLIEVVDGDGKVVSTVAPGHFLLTDQVLAGGVSPHTVRAASTGALILFAPRMIAHELLVSVPPLLEILAG